MGGSGLCLRHAGHDTVKESRNVRRFFKVIVAEADTEGERAPWELRHTFASWMSDQGDRDELIADLVGHRNMTTRLVYRKQLRPVITKCTELLDEA